MQCLQRVMQQHQSHTEEWRAGNKYIADRVKGSKEGKCDGEDDAGQGENIDIVFSAI